MAGLKDFLRALPAFARFNDRQLDPLVGRFMVQNYPSGHVLLTQGESGAAMYIILSGVAVMSRVDRINDIASEPVEAHEGEVIGLLSLGEGIPSPETCRAQTPVQVALLTREHFRALFFLAPAVARQLEYMLAVQLARELQRGSEELRRGLARQRPKSLLERLFGK